MIVCHHATATHGQCCCSIVFTTATVGSVGSDSSGLVDATATVLMLVAMLSAFASAGKPFKSKLIFSESHKIIYLVRVEGLEPSIPYGRLILSQLRIPFRHTRICLVRPGNSDIPTKRL